MFSFSSGLNQISKVKLKDLFLEHVVATVSLAAATVTMVKRKNPRKTSLHEDRRWLCSIDRRSITSIYRSPLNCVDRQSFKSIDRHLTVLIDTHIIGLYVKKKQIRVDDSSANRLMRPTRYREEDEFARGSTMAVQHRSTEHH
ncbi:hypothetical protein F2Q70_00015471 [Brassica cretica]|uniref:Uncharacterized protein n=1 Tax=Brassica cretica TaxID=69181 RepID=A0A8S9I059_BRACR|nr:hypothetical protein F2Q70_00015471 [Brassica cretica]